MSQSDDKFAEEIQQRLSQSLTDIDDQVLTRLSHARMRAVKIAEQKVPQDTASEIVRLSFPRWLAPASAMTTFATIGFVAITIWAQPDIVTQPSFQNTIIDDIAVLNSQDDLELYENLDFYIWLDNDDATS